MNTDKQQRTAAAAFAKRWEGRGYEKGDSQTFWIELLTEIFGVRGRAVQEVWGDGRGGKSLKCLAFTAFQRIFAAVNLGMVYNTILPKPWNGVCMKQKTHRRTVPVVGLLLCKAAVTSCSLPSTVSLTLNFIPFAIFPTGV